MKTVMSKISEAVNVQGSTKNIGVAILMMLLVLLVGGASLVMLINSPA
ncbi:MAG: hypothetical protein M3413_09015 [Bacteroidota bacterium]|jgi:hypothetical protein|nr:hypothetical protein [Bacteroidota bacterium]